MKKLIAFLFILSAFQLAVQAQCTPDANIGSGLIYPESMGNAMAGYSYSQVVTFRVPSDSNILYNGSTVHATIDSARLLYIGGVPTGFSYSCNTNLCTWNGGTLGCALISSNGLVDSARVGVYPITFYVQTWAHINGTLAMTRVDSNSSYEFKILAYNGIGQVARVEPLNVYPNPSEGVVNIELRNRERSPMLLQVHDATGRLIMERSFEPDSYLKTEQVELGYPGLYLVTLAQGQRLRQQRVLIR